MREKMIINIISCFILFTLFGAINGQSSCTTPDGRPGSCISIRDCAPLKNFLSDVQAGRRDVQDLRAYVCDFATLSLCCANSDSVFRTSGPSNPSPPAVSTAGGGGGAALLPTQCGVQGLTDRIVGGAPAELGAWPWAVTLRGKFDSRSLFFCGGTLITDRYVLSAAHCFVPGLEVEFARIGELDFNRDPDCTPFGLCAPKHQDIPVEQIINHHQYNKGCNRNFCNDISLVRLSRKVELDPLYVMPACLPINPIQDLGYTVEEYQGKQAWAVGWGVIEQNQRRPIFPDILQQVQLPIGELQFCRVLKQGYPNQESIFCAGGETGKDTCKGDSGGPLLLTDTNGFIYYVVGVTSKGPTACGGANTQGIYTNVNYFIDWILQNLKP